MSMRFRCRGASPTNRRKSGRSLPARLSRICLEENTPARVGGGPPPKESPYTDMIGDIFGEASALIDGVQGGGVDVGDEGIFAYDAETEG